MSSVVVRIVSDIDLDHVTCTNLENLSSDRLPLRLLDFGVKTKMKSNGSISRCKYFSHYAIL